MFGWWPDYQEAERLLRAWGELFRGFGLPGALVLVALILRAELRALVDRVRTVKGGGLEADFNAKLDRVSADVEQQVLETAGASPDVSEPAPADQEDDQSIREHLDVEVKATTSLETEIFRQRLERLEMPFNDPIEIVRFSWYRLRAQVVDLAAIVLRESNDKTRSRVGASLGQVLGQLVERGTLEADAAGSIELLGELYQAAQNRKVTYREAAEFAETADRMLRLLRQRRLTVVNHRRKVQEEIRRRKSQGGPGVTRAE